MHICVLLRLNYVYSPPQPQNAVRLCPDVPEMCVLSVPELRVLVGRHPNIKSDY